MEAEEGEGGAIRLCGSAAMDVVRVALLAFRLYLGERAFPVR